MKFSLGKWLLPVYAALALTFLMVPIVYTFIFSFNDSRRSFVWSTPRRGEGGGVKAEATPPALAMSHTPRGLGLRCRSRHRNVTPPPRCRVPPPLGS